MERDLGLSSRCQAKCEWMVGSIAAETQVVEGDNVIHDVVKLPTVCMYYYS